MYASVQLPLLAMTSEEHLRISSSNAGLIGEGLVAIGALLGAVYVIRRIPIWWDRWSKYRIKRERTKIAMGNREVALRELVQDILGDGLLDAVVKGKISQQEESKLYAWLNERLDLPDLIPPKKKAEMVKERLKKNRALGVNKTKTTTNDDYGQREVEVKIPGDKPAPLKRNLWPEKKAN